jgi:hypothetical protein
MYFWNVLAVASLDDIHQQESASVQILDEKWMDATKHRGQPEQGDKLDGRSSAPVAVVASAHLQKDASTTMMEGRQQQQHYFPSTDESSDQLKSFAAADGP